MADTYTVDFVLESGQRISAKARAGESLLTVAHRVDVAIDAPCSGNGTCGKCKVKLESGALGGERPKKISDEAFEAGERLACISEVDSDVVIKVPEAALAYQNQIRVSDFSGGTAQDVLGALAQIADLDTAALGFEALQITLEEPTLDDPMADKERLIDQVAAQTGVPAENVSISLTALRVLPEVMREQKFEFYITLKRSGDYVHILEASVEELPLLGAAIDIGTTSVSALLINLVTGQIVATRSAGNAQIRYGADVIGRLIESARPGGLERLQKAITEKCIAPLLKTLSETGEVSTQSIYRVSIAGNTTMTHLFAGIYGNHLRMEPYVPAFFDFGTITGEQAKIGVHPDATVVVAPNIGSYVGGDITAGVFASQLHKQETFSLLIDLGTNGEIVFGNSDFMMGCACSAGPAFEGGEISCGMRATNGAIDSCTIDPETLDVSYTVIGPEGEMPIGLCGSGIIDIIGELFKTDVINAKGRFIREDDSIYTDEWNMTYFTIVPGDKTENGEPITINDADIDNFIRAKGSIFSAIVTMLNTMGMDPSVLEDVYIAGGIGSGIDIEHAIGIGMLPKIDLDKYHYIGNTSLAGSYAMLISPDAVQEIKDITSMITYVELSVYPGYMDEFIAACFLPHTDARLFE